MRENVTRLNQREWISANLHYFYKIYKYSICRCRARFLLYSFISIFLFFHLYVDIDNVWELDRRAASFLFLSFFLLSTFIYSSMDVTLYLYKIKSNMQHHQLLYYFKIYSTHFHLLSLLLSFYDLIDNFWESISIGINNNYE